MNWYLQNGKDSDVAISTRVRLARNINGYRFNINEAELELLENKIKDNIFSLGFGLKFFKLKDMDDITKLSLVEKNLITSEFAFGNKNASILINDDENICIMIGEEDHIRIQVYNSGADLESTLNLAIEIDEKLEEILGYCINKKYGYLTTCPNNLGTGLRASVRVHLPALSKTRNLEKVLEAVSNFGINIKGIYDKNNKIVGDMYQISNKQTLGLSEKEIIQNLKIIVEKIIRQEREARRFLANEGIDLEDQIYREYGILSNCKKITSEETKNLLSIVKMGVDLGILNELTDLKIQKLYLYTQSGNLQKYLGQQLETLERDVERAKVIKQIINE